MNKIMRDGHGELCCTASVWRKGDYHSSVCARRAKYDHTINGNATRCGIHSAAKVAERKRKSDERYAVYKQKQDIVRTLRSVQQDAHTVLLKIAEGHNDPRTIAQEWVQRFNEAKESK